MKYVIGMFDDAAQAARAEAAVKGLATVERLHGREGNVYSRLNGYGLSKRELDMFAEGSRRGSILLVAKCEDARAPEIARLFQEGSVDLDRRYARWQTEGFRGYEAQSPYYDEPSIQRERELGRDEIRVPVVEESIAVGKREIQQGVRVETKVTQQPFEQNVTLRNEHIEVERRKVDRPASPADELKEGVVEMRAIAEEPVVEKQARVVEEVVLKKEGEARQETIRDNVKRTDVQVKPIERTSKERISRTSGELRPSQR